MATSKNDSSRQITPLAAFAFLAIMAALMSSAETAAMPQSHGVSRMVLVGEDQQPSLFLLLGPHGWVQQQPMVFGGSAAPRNRFLPPLSSGTRGNKVGEDSGVAEGKVEKKWSRFEPSIRFF
ncbi:hypothetical protein GPALN_005236 [Globodera pallida]|nr:hypothetical protein GPALN_005236 [Globodera pallida]